MHFNLWEFNEEKLEYQKVSLKPLLFPVFMLIFALLFCFLPIFNVSNFDVAAKKTVTEKTTGFEYLKYIATQRKYDEQARQFNNREN